MKKRKLSKAERDGELGFKLMEDLKKTITLQRMGFLAMIENLETIFDKQLYKDILGDEEASWVALLGQVEVYIPRSVVIQHIRAKKRLKELGFEYRNMHQVPAERILRIAREAKDEKHAEELYGMAKTLLNREWNDEMNKLKGRPSIDDGHEHKLKTYKQCEVCGMKSHDVQTG